MNSSRILVLTAVFAVLGFSQSTLAQKIKISAPPFATGTTADIWIMLDEAKDVTSLRIMNVTTDTDTYKTRQVSNKETAIPFRLNVVNTDGSENIYYVYAFNGTDQVAGTFDPTNRITIRSYKAPVGSSGLSAPQSPTAGGSAVNVSKEGDGNAKLALQAPAVVSNQSSVSVQVKRGKLLPMLGNYVVEVKHAGGISTTTDVPMEQNDKKEIRDKQDISVALKEGDNAITIYPKIAGEAQKTAGAQIDVACSNCNDAGSSSSTRAVIGFEQIGASSSNSKQSPFLDFYFDTPLTYPFGKKNEKCNVGTNGCGIDGQKLVPDRHSFSLWGRVRLSNIPVQRLVGFGSPTGFATFLTDTNSQVNEFAQSFDFMIGLQSTKLPLGLVLDNGFFPGKTSVHAFFGLGAVNPLSTDKTAQIFKIPKVRVNGMMVNDPEFVKLFPEAEGKENIAFVTPERDKFFRQWFAGLRFKTNFFEDGKPAKMFPAMFDVAIGQNEAVTQTLRGMVLKGDGSTPLPIKGGILSIFGSVQMRLGRKVDQRVQSLFLANADPGVLLSNPGTAIVPIGRYPNTVTNRDIFRIGLGIDLFKLFKGTEEKK